MSHYGHGHAPRSGRSRSRKPVKKKRRVPSAVLVSGLAVVGLLVLWGALVGWRVLGAKSDLDRATAQAEDLKQALSDQDVARAKASLDDLQASLYAADGKLSDSPVKLASHLPFVGANIRAVRTVNTALVSIASDGLPPVVQQASRLGNAAFQPKGGRLDLEDLSSLAAPLSTAASVLGKADTTIQSVDAGSLISPVASAVRRAQREVGDAATTAKSGSIAAKVLPTMLGAEAPRRYLILLANNAEMRSVSGLPGQMVLVTADAGRISLDSVTSARQLGPNWDPEGLWRGMKTSVDFQPPTLSSAETRLFSGRPNLDARDTLMIPDFPRAASLARTLWSKNGKPPVDGVIMMDSVAVADLLGSTNPISTSLGRVGQASATDVLLRKAYLKLDENQQDLFFGKFGDELFSRISSGRVNTKKLLTSLHTSVVDRRLLVWSADPEMQDVLAPTDIAGDLEASRRPTVGVFASDARYDKLTAYLDYSAGLVSARCAAGVPTYSGQFDVTSKLAPGARLSSTVEGVGSQRGLPRGTAQIDVFLYPTRGGKMSSVEVGGKAVRTVSAKIDGRDVQRVRLTIRPGQKQRLTFVTTTPGSTARPDLLVTPGAYSAGRGSVAGAPCS